VVRVRVGISSSEIISVSIRFNSSIFIDRARVEFDEYFVGFPLVF